jgi:hypothetical protein
MSFALASSFKEEIDGISIEITKGMLNKNYKFSSHHGTQK